MNYMYQDELLNSIVNPNWNNQSFEAERDMAYNEGFKKGYDAKELAVRSFFETNMGKATSLAEKLYLSFNDMKFKCKTLVLKPRDIRSFELLFIVDEATYLSPARKEVYKLIRDLKKDNNSSEFQLECHIMPESGEINMNLMSSEGFSFRYEPKSR